MDDQLASAAAADDPYFPLEDERNSFRAITSGPENITCRKPLLDRLREEGLPSHRCKALENVWAIRVAHEL
jgi:hypothetical protein